MYAIELPVRDAEDAARLVRALGSHRYVKSRLHLVHAIAFAALSEVPELAEGSAWARAVLAREGVFADVDAGSRDPRLLRPSTEVEVATILGRYWAPGPEGDSARAALRSALTAAGIALPTTTPFDETAEEEMFPVLVDAGWELLGPEELDPERHKGMIAVLDEADDDDLFDDDDEFPSGDEPPGLLHELPALGPAELLEATDARGLLAHPFVLWVEGPSAYHDYLVRGVCRAARLGEPV